MRLALDAHVCALLTAHRSTTGGLGWGGNMRFRTGLNLIDLTAEVSRRLEHVKFPFLIMHDPEDSEFTVFIASKFFFASQMLKVPAALTRPHQVQIDNDCCMWVGGKFGSTSGVAVFGLASRACARNSYPPVLHHLPNRELFVFSFVVQASSGSILPRS